MFCMHLISLHCLKTAYGLVWNVTPVSIPLILGGRVSLPRALRGSVWGGEKWHFRLRMDIYVHPGINKKGIQRKHISLFWVGREGHNEQTLSFSTDDWKTHLVEIMFFQIDQCILFTIFQTSTSVRQESITVTPMLSVTTLKVLTIVHANQDLPEMALTAQVKKGSENPQLIALNNLIWKHFYSTNFFWVPLTKLYVTSLEVL